MKRREFIVKGGLVSTGIVASTSALNAMSKRISLNDTVNIGVIGTGDRGTGLISLMNGIEGINVGACCDILPFRLEKGLQKAGGKAKTYTNYKHLLDDKSIDAVLISSTFNTHGAIAIDALDAGKHVYCEKTMAKGYDDIEKLLQKATNSDTIFQTGHQYHSSRLYHHVVDLIKKGEIGTITAFECQWNRNGNWRRPVPDPSLERAINWRMYREYSGGLTAELCSHQIDFVNWVLGENPKKIMGTGGVNYWKDGRETYDNVHLLFEYPSGVKAKFTSLTSNAFDAYQILVKGDKGTITITTSKAWVSYEKGFEKEVGDVDGVSGATVNAEFFANRIPININHQNPSKQALIDFKNSIINNTQPISNVQTGANTALAVQLSLDAMLKNKVMYWKDSFNF